MCTYHRVLLVAITCCILIVSGCVWLTQRSDKNLELIENVEEIQQIRYKNWLWNYINESNFIMLGDTLYTRRDVWDNAKPTEIWIQGVIVHETVHAKRQAETGLSSWLFSYFCNSKFRWEEERLAYEQEFRYLIEHGQRINYEYYYQWRAKDISGPVYGYMVSYDEAYNWVKYIIELIAKEVQARESGA